jgi:acyl-coenzyme A thioesterase PaaI-like protein
MTDAVVSDAVGGRSLVELIERGSPFSTTLGTTLVSHDSEKVVVTAATPATLNNHVGGPHAATLFGFAETAAAGVIVTLFEDLVRAGVVPLIKSAEIVYSAITFGPVTATGQFKGDEAGVRASIQERGVAVFPVDVSICTADGTETARMHAQMALKKL